MGRPKRDTTKDMNKVTKNVTKKVTKKATRKPSKKQDDEVEFICTTYAQPHPEENAPTPESEQPADCANSEEANVEEEPQKGEETEKGDETARSDQEEPEKVDEQEEVEDELELNEENNPSQLKQQKHRGPTKMKHIAKDPNARERVDFNDMGEPVGPGSVKLSSYLGPLVREHVPVTVEDWRKVSEEVKTVLWKSIQVILCTSQLLS